MKFERIFTATHKKTVVEQKPHMNQLDAVLKKSILGNL